MPVRTRLRPHHPSSTVTPALSSHPSSHPSSSSVTSHQTYLVTSHQAPCESRVHSVLVEKGSLPRLSTSRSRDQIRSYFQLPALHPIFISFISLCSGPVYRRLGVTASPHFRQARWPIQFRQPEGFVNLTSGLGLPAIPRARPAAHSHVRTFPNLYERGRTRGLCVRYSA